MLAVAATAWTDTGLVFTTKSGLPVEPRNLNRSFDRICDGNGIRRVSVHAMRHTAASLLKALGVPPRPPTRSTRTWTRRPSATR